MEIYQFAYCATSSIASVRLRHVQMMQSGKIIKTKKLNDSIRPTTKTERQEIAPTAHRIDNCEHVDTLEAIQTYEIFVFR